MMKSFEFEAVYVESERDLVLNPQDILVPEFKVRMTLTEDQIEDLLLKLLPKLEPKSASLY